MSVALTLLLIAFCVQGLVKFAAGFLVPYQTRINRIAAYYRRDGRIISIYDSVTLAIIVALVVLLFLTGMQELSFITVWSSACSSSRSFPPRQQTVGSGSGTRNADSTKKTHVLRHPSRARPRLARDRADDRPFVWALYELIGRLIE